LVYYTSIVYFWNNNDMEKLKEFENSCPGATLFTINPTRTGLGLNPGLHCEPWQDIIYPN
jgi:hypothetical protein